MTFCGVPDCGDHSVCTREIDGVKTPVCDKHRKRLERSGSTEGAPRAVLIRVLPLARNGVMGVSRSTVIGEVKRALAPWRVRVVVGDGNGEEKDR